MVIAGGVYVETCVTPETVQLLGSAGRAALALCGMRDHLVLHAFHPPDRWEDLRANFAPFGIICEPHASAERIAFSYLFPLGRPVQTPVHARHAGVEVVEGRDILSFGCVEGRFVVEGDAVVHDPQGSFGAGFRAGGGTANRLALILNAQELLTVTGGGSIADAASALLHDEDATLVVVKDGPQGATLFNRQGEEHWIPPYQSSRLYKIGSGDVFSATFAHWWFQGVEAPEAVDRASKQTAAYVESPVLPLVVSDEFRLRRFVRVPKHVTLVAEASRLTDRWLVAIVADALRRLGIAEIEKLNLRDWLAGETPSPGAEGTAVLICLSDGRDMAAVRSRPTASRQVIFVDQRDLADGEGGSTGPFTDLSQAIYELFWDPQ